MSGQHNGRWQFWIDRGGTFTDIVARDPHGRLLTRKLLSEHPAHYSDAVLHGIREMLGVPAQDKLTSQQIAAVKIGTTVATNALLERNGEATLLVTTCGFRDAWLIGYQNRPQIFALHITKTPPLYHQVVEIDERVTASGEVLQSPDPAQIHAVLTAAYQQGLRAVAIVFMHGHAYPAHEQRVAACARAIGYTQISVSHQVSPLQKLVSRGDTTIADAYLTPVLRRYQHHLMSELGDVPLLFMQSSGGLSDGAHFHGRDAMLSGPAGGIVGMATVAHAAGVDKVIGFDMGGTSTDVSHYAGEYERVFETELAGIRLRAPMMRIHTIAAGGGSLLSWDGARFRVGPGSAGAAPGPACYRNNGPLTVTDCNIMLGRLQPQFFPALFGPAADQPPDVEVVRHKFEQLARQIELDSGRRLSAAQVASGFLTIAIDNMANAIKKISLQRGHDLEGYTLCAFGGAAGQHACLVAAMLGIRRILLHPLAGVLSAYGIGCAALRCVRQHAVERPLTAALLPSLEPMFIRLEAEAGDEVGQRPGFSPPPRLIRRMQLRVMGSDTPLLIDYGSLVEMTAQFALQHRRQFGFVAGDDALMVEALQVEAVAEAMTEPFVLDLSPAASAAMPVAEADIMLAAQVRPTPVYQRAALGRQDQITGPALVVEPHGAIVIEPGWQARVGAQGELWLSQQGMMDVPQHYEDEACADPVRLEIFNNLFMAAAEQMGVVLENTAVSVNIKERKDFSCALFNADGELIANAPHIPVHLGSMSDCIRAVRLRFAATLQPGDGYLLNSPYHGGTHLPDMTVVCPVFADQGVAEGQTLLGFVAARGHHADIGGITPGSMPPDSRHIDEEGVLIDGLQIMRDHVLLQAQLERALASGRYPARNPLHNIADLRAQLAACAHGGRALQDMAARYGVSTVQAYMGHVLEYAAQCVQRLLPQLRDGRFRYPMDDGSIIAVTVRIDRAAGRATIDFTGSSPRHPGNFNAPAAVCRAAVLYVLRCLLQQDIPLNDGFLRPVELIIPQHSMLRPEYPAAVVAGNVETSQYLVDALFGALGVLAASQGTCNNLTFGDQSLQYYETICGGAGAGPGFDGASAVQTHMTNSRLTDPEVLEQRFPVLLQEFALRSGSGGAGQYHGGDGVRRRLRFLQPLQAAIISGHRAVPPFGVAGGSAGAVGHNYLIRSDGTREPLAACAVAAMQRDDCIVIETPGGGGYGSAGA